MTALQRWIIAVLQTFGRAGDRRIIALVREKFDVAESTVRGARLALLRRGLLEPAGTLGKRPRRLWRLKT